VLWSQIKCSERYFINLTDHAFWLGKNTGDFFLEFRNFGCNISFRYRHIPLDRLLVQPYYPLATKNLFEGFPIEKGNRVFAFSGSNYNKIYGKNFLFLKLIKEVLSQNGNLIFLLAGNGNKKPLTKFIRKNKLQDRLLLIGSRGDLSEVFRRIDIYVNTYPFMGGLMSQYAAISCKPIIGYTDLVDYGLNDTEDLLGIKRCGLIVKSSQTEFIKYFNLLINSQNEREKNISYIKNAIISENHFAKLLKDNLFYKKSVIDPKDLINTISIEDIFETFHDIEVNYLNEYYFMIFETLRKDIFDCNFIFIFRIFLGAARKTRSMLGLIYKILFNNIG
jgi:glycosyltransferase involved in cell wall biosynthesis